MKAKVACFFTVSFFLFNLAFADGLFNEYEIHSLESVTLEIFGGETTIDFLPYKKKEGGVNISGSPFKLRVVCTVRNVGGCSLNGQIIQLKIGSNNYESIKVEEVSVNEWNGQTHYSFILPGIDVDTGDKVCVLPLSFKQEICFSSKVETFNRFFLIDWWGSI